MELEVSLYMFTVLLPRGSSDATVSSPTRLLPIKLFNNRVELAAVDREIAVFAPQNFKTFI